MNKNILIVEDNADLASLIQLHVADIQCDADIALDGEQAIELYEKNAYDLVLLDIMLPAVNGLDVCKMIRQNSGYVPIIMLTSKSSEIDRVVGLEIGADDYISKPFSFPELLARIKAQFRSVDALVAVTNRQENTKKDAHMIQAHGLSIDIEKRLLVLQGRKATIQRLT